MFHRLLLAGAVTLGVLVPGTPVGAAAASTMTPTLTCDGASRTVSASVAGSFGFAANTQLTVYAWFYIGAWDLADPSIQPRRGTIQNRPPATVTVTTDATGAFATPVFTNPFVGTHPVANYTETWGFRVIDPNRGEIWRQYTSCRYDTRTVGHFDCDGDGYGNVSVSGSGLNPAVDPTLLVTYYWNGADGQRNDGEPVFVTHPDPLNLPVSRQVTVTVNADGTWSDTGFPLVNTDPGWSYRWIHYKITIGRNGIVGGADGTCTLIDRRTP